MLIKYMEFMYNLVGSLVSGMCSAIPLEIDIVVGSVPSHICSYGGSIDPHGMRIE